MVQKSLPSTLQKVQKHKLQTQKKKEGSQRRLDAWFAAQRALSGPNGVVAARLVPRENAAFSYVNTHTRKECSKESDHDCVQIILRGTSIPRPKARTTLRLSTLRHPDMRQAMRALNCHSRA